MHQKRTRFAYQVASCDLCHSPIDFASGFFFELEDGSGAIVHPDCMAYFLTHHERPTLGVIHTCGEPLCVKPDHLEVRVIGG
jgi:hypothetical protein